MTMMDCHREVLADTIFVRRKHSWLRKKRYTVALTERDGIGVETSHCEVCLLLSATTFEVNDGSTYMCSPPIEILNVQSIVQF